MASDSQKSKTKKKLKKKSAVAQYLAERRAAAELRKMPTMSGFRSNKAIAAISSKSWGGGGGGSLADLGRGVAQAIKGRAHAADFKCRCRISGTVSSEWQWMRDRQCEAWVPRGDLLIASAERFAADRGLDHIENGAERLVAVYRLLDADEAAAKVAAEAAAEKSE